MQDSSENLLVTGKAGTGKSTLLQHFRDTTEKVVAVLAPTGVAAVNVGGQTIHSFFNFRPDITPRAVKKAFGDLKRKLYCDLDALVIDEASMVRADLLDCVDKSLRANRGSDEPFGGVQILLFGDLHQLPPVVTERDKPMLEATYASPYFFDSHAYQNTDFSLVELTTIYRQKDEAFIRLLNAVRNNELTPNDLTTLNSRTTPTSTQAMKEGLRVTVTATNDIADSLNQRKLDELPSFSKCFEATFSGSFDQQKQPAPATLELKKNAQIMLLNNDSQGRWVNGTVGVIQGFSYDEGKPIVDVRLSTGEEASVGRYRWTSFEYVHDPKENAFSTRETGSFTQFPLRLAWAVTIHKSQGKTFDAIHLDTGRGLFAPGQLYVALSRCRTLQGITLAKPIERKDALTNPRVTQFLSNTQKAPRQMKIETTYPETHP